MRITALVVAFCCAIGHTASAEEIAVGRRIACQRSIEEVYWRHRLWPGDNKEPKPALSQVMSDHAIVRKVDETLAASRELDITHGWPITDADLRAELERMKRESLDVAMLRELLAAVGGDDDLQAECMARPVLAASRMEMVARGRSRRLAEADVSRTTATASAAENCNDIWTTTSSSPKGRELHTAVWTGAEMLVWGGFSVCENNIGCFLNDGARYDPATNSWSSIGGNGAPESRGFHTAVWTGTRMIVWGGSGHAPSTILNSGGMYDPMTGGWSATSLAGAPSARYDHYALWTGSRMIVWGGSGLGYLFDPASNSWSQISTEAAPAPYWKATAVWTGSRMLVWGGSGDVGSEGGQYDPATDTWYPMTHLGEPASRNHHVAVWAGGRMVVWGGYSNRAWVSTGGRYDPVTDTWAPTSTVHAPEARIRATVVSTGKEMIVWGGEGNETGGNLNTGGRYDPVTDTWTATSTASAPTPRMQHSMIWTGKEVIIFGGGATIFEAHIPAYRYCATASAKWIALGDSYSSGEGAGRANYLTGTNTSGNQCHRSDTAYSRTVLNSPLTAPELYACSGATTRNVIPSTLDGYARCRQQDDPPACVPFAFPDDIPQLDQSGLASADLITITIGGNDILFGDVLQWCWKDDDCEQFEPPGWDVTLGVGIPQLITVLEFYLEETFDAIAAKAPNASIRVLGYPAIFPALPQSQACPRLTSVCGKGWSPAEQTWLNSLVPQLNQIIAQAAANTGVRYIDVTSQFAGHEICGPEGSWFIPPPFGAFECAAAYWAEVSAEVFHPTPKGHLEGYRRALEADLLAVPAEAGRTIVTQRVKRARPPSNVARSLGALRVKVIASPCGEIASGGQGISLSGDGFAGGAAVTVMLDGSPLATIPANGGGAFGTTITLPASVTPQARASVTASGTGKDGEPRVLVAHITIGMPFTVDQDGDGVPDACDFCPDTYDPENSCPLAVLVAPANVNASATSTSTVQVTWNAVPDAVGYEIHRRAPGGTLNILSSSTDTTFTDGSAIGGQAYLYRVKALAGGPASSPHSEGDIATTIAFSDHPVVPRATFIRAAHVLELRSAVAAVRMLAGIAPATYTTPTLQGVVRTVHVTELRAALSSALTALGVPPRVFTEPSLSPGNPINAIHINELRSAMQ